MTRATGTDLLRQLPSVQEVLVALGPDGARYPHALAVREIRNAIEMERRRILAGDTDNCARDVVEQARRALEHLNNPSLRRVINGTGVVLHTNLGRAPLQERNAIGGYSNLEYDLETGRRGKRDSHIAELLAALLEAPAIAVNNGAAATLLALNELALGHEVIVSRGELIEIGDGFRIPEILERSGAILREVGTTNRTRIEDYRAAINPRTRVILRVHPSNFHISGFTKRPELPELVALGREHGLPVYEDLGSGNVVDLRPYGIHEPLVQESLRAGVNLVSFSGDKLLAGPQAGILAGDAALIQRLRRNPLFRALRLDKLITQVLEDTLRKLVFEEWECLPALRMISQGADEIKQRAKQLFPEFAIIPGESVIGGGSTPDQSVPTFLVVVASDQADAVERKLRGNDPPVISRIKDGRVLLDLRTVFPEEEQYLREAVDRAR